MQRQPPAEVETPRPAARYVGEEPVEEGFEEEHIHIGPSSIWPITSAAGATLFGAGFVTNEWVGLGGLIILFWAIVMWVQELRHEPH
ncbi:MAG: hypothetical protein ACRDFS_05645 [Chloroflexota bacterium]